MQTNRSSVIWCFTFRLEIKFKTMTPEETLWPIAELARATVYCGDCNTIVACAIATVNTFTVTWKPFRLFKWSPLFEFRITTFRLFIDTALSMATVSVAIAIVYWTQ